MDVMTEPIPHSQPLAAALVSDFARVGHLYESDPSDSASWRARAEWLDHSEKTRVNRHELVLHLREFNRNVNPHEAVSRSLDLLEQPGSAVIVGGQQAGLFTGPLLVIYKAITIIQAAAEAERKLSRPVIPVFWIAGEDHDWDEVNHTYVLSHDLQIARIRMNREDELRTPVSYTQPSKEEWERVIRELSEFLPDTEFKPDLIADIEASAQGSLTDSFAKLMGKWFGPYGLVMLDSANPKLRNLEGPIFEQMIAHNNELRSAYLEAAGQVRALHLETQAEVAHDGVNLFYIHEGERLLLFEHDGKYEDRMRRVSFTIEELKRLAHEHPDRFSNNVLTRPLMQDSVLPVLGTVLGEGEIAYWGLTKAAFGVIGLQMPILLPRMSFTLVDGALQKYMSSYGVTFGDLLQDQYDAKRNKWLDEQDNFHLDEQFEEIKVAFEGLYDPLISQLDKIQTGLSILGMTNRAKIIDQIDYLYQRSKGAVKKSNEAGLRRWDRIELSLLPSHKLQERVYNVFAYLNRYGTYWIEELMKLPYEVEGTHRLILL